jgi:hypothetical protein
MIEHARFNEADGVAALGICESRDAFHSGIVIPKPTHPEF